MLNGNECSAIPAQANHCGKEPVRWQDRGIRAHLAKQRREGARCMHDMTSSPGSERSEGDTASFKFEAARIGVADKDDPRVNASSAKSYSQCVGDAFGATDAAAPFDQDHTQRR